MGAGIELVKTSTPGVYRKGDAYLFIYRHRGKQIKKFTGKNYKDTCAERAQVLADISRGEHRTGSAQTFGDYADQWIDTYTGRTTRGFRDETRVGYRRAVEEAAPFFDKRCKRLAVVEPQDMKAYIAWLFEEKDGKVPALSTVRNRVAAVRAMLGTAAEDGVIRHNPALGVRISRPGGAVEQAKVIRALERDELDRVMAALPEDRRLFVKVLLQTAARIGEAVELRWKDIEFGESPRVNISRRFYKGNLNAPKSAYGTRTVPLSRGLAQQLWRSQGAADDLVFTEAGGYVNQDKLRSDLRKAGRAAGLDWTVTPHTFRHTCASMLFAEGRNIKQVQQWLGHHDPAFTLQRYVHLLDQGVGDAEFFDGPGATPGATGQAETARNAKGEKSRKAA